MANPSAHFDEGFILKTLIIFVKRMKTKIVCTLYTLFFSGMNKNTILYIQFSSKAAITQEYKMVDLNISQNLKWQNVLHCFK